MSSQYSWHHVRPITSKKCLFETKPKKSPVPKQTTTILSSGFHGHLRFVLIDIFTKNRNETFFFLSHIIQQKVNQSNNEVSEETSRRLKKLLEFGNTSMGLVLSSNSVASCLLSRALIGLHRDFEDLNTIFFSLSWRNWNFTVFWWEFLTKISHPEEPIIEKLILKHSRIRFLDFSDEFVKVFSVERVTNWDVNLESEKEELKFQFDRQFGFWPPRASKIPTLRAGRFGIGILIQRRGI